ncbi:MAG TPA: glycosyltransferase family 39 protein [Vicinamibacteria bacterium]
MKAVTASPAARRRLWLAAVFLAGFAVRSLHAVDQAPTLYSHLQEGTRMAGRYDDAALSILRGEGVLFPAQPDPADTGRLARPPGYAAFLAAVYAALGRSFFVVQLLQNLAASLAPVMVVLLGERLVGWRVGLLAGWMAALSSHLAYTTNLILADALCPLPLLLGLLLLIPASDAPLPSLGPALARAAAAGALFGLGVWLRPNVLLLGLWAAAAAALLVQPWRRALAQAAMVAAASLLVVAPITLRNWMVYRELVPVSINGGITLLQGVADAGGRRFGVRPRDKLVIEEEAAYYGDDRLAEWWAAPDGIRRDRERYAEAMREIRAQPLWYTRAMVRRMADLLSYHRGGAPLLAPWPAALRFTEPPSDGTLDPAFGAGAALLPGRALGFLRPAVWAAQNAIRWITLPLLIVGTVALLRQRPRAAGWLWLLPSYYLFFESFFIYEWRVAVPMHYPVFVLAAAGLLALVDAARTRGR